MYLMTQTRPDISFSVQWLSRQLVKPNSTHLNAAKNLLRYLHSTKNLAICYGKAPERTTEFQYVNKSLGAPEQEREPQYDNKSSMVKAMLVKTDKPLSCVKAPELRGTAVNKSLTHPNSGLGQNCPLSIRPIGFSDSDFAGCHVTSKSTYGYTFLVNGGPISWKTKRHTTIALSTLEAETDAFQESFREADWLIGLFTEIRLPLKGPMDIYGDNQGSIKTAYDPTQHSRTKHTLLKYHYVR